LRLGEANSRADDVSDERVHASFNALWWLADGRPGRPRAIQAVGPTPAAAVPEPTADALQRRIHCADKGRETSHEMVAGCGSCARAAAAARRARAGGYLRDKPASSCLPWRRPPSDGAPHQQLR
jgi:hypothetical protein